MPDYKELYLKLFRASEEAVNHLIAAQQECEELYLSQDEQEGTMEPLTKGRARSAEAE
ncbi:hypothetical protein [Oscillibacter sp.]|uniref:hypothetical protein n=1 Tax=Oscillibacter sp. TaxID=1945593 RepID=UPI0028B16AF9|nr:hypothetical protein [Oscillibacter sp.]